MVTLEDVPYRDGALACKGVLATPDGGGNGAGVLLLPAAFGLADHARERARMLAELGYTAFAADHFGDGLALSTMEDAMKHAGPLMSDKSAYLARMRAALAVLRDQPGVDAARLGAIGFCMGGTGVLELALAGEALQAVVSFHGGLKLSRDSADALTAAVLVCHGDADPFVPPEDVAALEAMLRAGKADWQVHVYGGVVHAFTDRVAGSFGTPAAAYDADADRRSWAAMEALFAQRLG